MGFPHRSAFIATLLLTSSLIASSPSSAALVHVPAERPTIQSGIDAAVPGDTVLVAAGYYTGSGNRNLEFQGKAITVMSEGGSGTCTLDCEVSGRGFFIKLEDDGEPLIQGFTIINGFTDEYGEAAGGGIRIQYGSATLRDIHVRDCESSSWGGGIHAYYSSYVKLENCVIRNCSADGNGGGVSIWESFFFGERILVTGNIATGLGSGLYLDEGFNTLDQSIIAFNEGDGEGLHVATETTAYNLNCNILYGNLNGDYGGFAIDATGDNGNLSEDPLFCDPGLGDYHLHARSSGLPGNNSCSEQIGPFGEGCDHPLFLISGLIAQVGGEAISGTIVNGGPVPAYSNSLGEYRVALLPGWTGTLQPEHPNFNFQPTQRNYSNVNSDFDGEHYEGLYDGVHHVPSEYASIQAAVSIALIGDTVLVAPGTYTGQGNSDINFQGKNISLIGSEGSAQTIIDGEGADLFSHLIIFEGGEGEAALVQGFTLTKMRHIMDGGALVCRNGSRPTLHDIQFVDNINEDWPYGYSNGGGLYCVGLGSSPSLENCRFEGNQYNIGGAVFCGSSASPTFTNVVFMGNSALHGGAVALSQASAEFLNCSFKLNWAERQWTSDNVQSAGNGGAVHCRGADCSAFFQDCLFTGNLAQDDYPVDPWDPNGGSGWGAVLYCDDGAQVEFDRCNILGNTSQIFETARGVVSIVGAAQVTMSQSIFANNEGGGFYCSADPGNLVAIGCSDVYGNGGGDFLGDCPDYSWSDGNISSDPLFCDPEGGDLRLNTISRCLPDNNECGLLMGYYGEGCNDPLFRIMGRVVDNGGLGVMGISLYSDHSHALTDSNGEYMIVVTPGWSGNITPESAGYEFTPATRTYSEVQADIDDQNFIALRDGVHSVPGDFDTIQEAINVSVVGDTVLVEAGVHAGPGNLNLFLYGKSITLLGDGSPEEVIIDGEHAERGIYILGEACSETVIKNLSFMNCLSTDPSTAAGGAIRVEESGCNLENLILRNCQSHTWGGGLHAHDGDLFISNVEVSGCFAWGNGGGVSFRSTIVSATGLLITGNESGYNQNGPGLYQENGTSDISASIIAFNNSETFTAGLIGTGEAILNLDCSDVFGNSFGNFGGVFEDLIGISGNISDDPRFCDPAQEGFSLAADSPCLPANNDCGLLMGPYGEGCQIPTDTPGEIPARAYLAQNVPNPFNPVTDIRFGLVEAGRVSLAIYDITGRRVANLLDGEWIDAGEQVVKWAGRDDSGRELSSGIYLYKLRANDREWTKKMTLIK